MQANVFTNQNTIISTIKMSSLQTESSEQERGNLATFNFSLDEAGIMKINHLAKPDGRIIIVRNLPPNGANKKGKINA